MMLLFADRAEKVEVSRPFVLASSTSTTTMSESDPLELTSLDTESLLTALLNAEKVCANHRGVCALRYIFVSALTAGDTVSAAGREAGSDAPEGKRPK